MAGITKKELSARRQRLRDELPNHGWDYVKAGIAAGYSPSYARARLKKYATKDSTFCQQVTAKRRQEEGAAKPVESIVKEGTGQAIAGDIGAETGDSPEAPPMPPKYPVAESSAVPF